MEEPSYDEDSAEQPESVDSAQPYEPAAEPDEGGTSSAHTPSQILYTMAFDNGHIKLHANESSKPAGSYAETENAKSSSGNLNGSKAVMKLYTDTHWHQGDLIGALLSAQPHLAQDVGDGLAAGVHVPDDRV